MVIAEAVGFPSGGKSCQSDGRRGALASIGKGKAAEGEVGRDGSLASHGESLAKANSMD
jgi:hypothetical protein